eukprot:9305975-Alexandrium_andersonii.AAC.1
MSASLVGSEMCIRDRLMVQHHLVAETTMWNIRATFCGQQSSHRIDYVCVPTGASGLARRRCASYISVRQLMPYARASRPRAPLFGPRRAST